MVSVYVSYAWKEEEQNRLVDKLGEVTRRHAGVAAKMVYLIAGGLDQDRGTGLPAMAKGRAKNEGMRGAD